MADSCRSFDGVRKIFPFKPQSHIDQADQDRNFPQRPDHRRKGSSGNDPLLSNVLPPIFTEGITARIKTISFFLPILLYYPAILPARNHPFVFLQIDTRKSMVGTSIRTPTTVASEAPDANPKSMVDVAMATSK